MTEGWRFMSIRKEAITSMASAPSTRAGRLFETMRLKEKIAAGLDLASLT
jgi:hypothetical protein